jgi:hypothetical protein
VVAAAIQPNASVLAPAGTDVLRIVALTVAAGASARPATTAAGTRTMSGQRQQEERGRRHDEDKLVAVRAGPAARSVDETTGDTSAGPQGEDQAADRAGVRLDRSGQDAHLGEGDGPCGERRCRHDQP